MESASRLLAAAFALGLPHAGLADVGDYIRVPAVEYGEREIETKYGSASSRDEPVRESAGSIGFGYGARPWWFTEAYVKYEKLPGERTRYDAVEWENKFQLTEPNRYPVDVGFIVEFEVPRERNIEGDELLWGPLFQTDTGPIRWNANLLFERHVRGNSQVPRVTAMSYELQAKHDLSRNFGVGVQAFGDLGEWRHWAPREEQSHRAGPALFGRVKLEGRNVIHYNAAWLFRTGGAAPGNTLRVQAEYEF